MLPPSPSTDYLMIKSTRATIHHPLNEAVHSQPIRAPSGSGNHMILVVRYFKINTNTKPKATCIPINIYNKKRDFIVGLDVI